MVRVSTLVVTLCALAVLVPTLVVVADEHETRLFSEDIEYVASGALAHADEETLLEAALLARSEVPFLHADPSDPSEAHLARRTEEPRMHPVTPLVDALADPIVAAIDHSQETSAHSFTQVESEASANAAAAIAASAEAAAVAAINAGTMTGAEMMARFGFMVSPAPKAPLPTEVQNFCLEPEPKKYGDMYINTMRCDKDANGNIPVGGKCTIQCKPSNVATGQYFVLSGSQYRCVQPNRNRGAELVGDQECVPGCRPFDYNTFKADFTATLERFGSYSALPGGCSVPIAEKKSCDIECPAGQQRIGTRFYCHPGSLTLTGTQKCREKTDEDKARRAALDADPAAKAAYQAQRKAEALAAKAAKGQQSKSARRLLGRLTEEEFAEAEMDVKDMERATSLTPEDLTPSMLEQMEQAIADLQTSTVDELKARTEVRGTMRARMTRHWQTPRFAQQSMAVKMFADPVQQLQTSTAQCTFPGCEAMNDQAAKVVTADPTLSKSGAFKEYVIGLLARIGGTKPPKVGGVGIPEVYIAIGSSKFSLQHGETGPQSGEKIKKGEISYVGLGELILKLSKKKFTTAETAAPGQTKTKANFQREDQCKTLPIDPETTYSFFSLMIDDNSLCFVWTGQGTFGIFFQMGDFIRNFIPPPFNVLLGGGLALSTSRELRMEEYRMATFGFGNSLEEGGHLIVPASCYTSVPAGKQLMGDVMGPTGMGCKGHVWAQLNLEWDPMTDFGTGESRIPEGAIQDVVDKAAKKDKLVLKVEGRASIMLDFQPNPVDSSELEVIKGEVATLEADREKMSEEPVAGQSTAPTTLALPAPTQSKDAKALQPAPATQQPAGGNKLSGFIKGAMKKMRNNGFSAFIDAQLTLKLEAHFIASFELTLDAIARILVQVGTTQKTPLGYSADGVYLKVGLHAGVAASTKDEGTNAPGLAERLAQAKEKAKKSIAGVKGALGKMYSAIRGSQPGSKIAEQPVFKDEDFEKPEEKEFQARAGMDITFQFNGDGFAIAIEATAFAVSKTGEAEKVTKTGAGIFFRMGLDGTLEFCALWGKGESCSHTNLIVYVRKVTQAIKAGAQRLIDWVARRPRKESLTAESSVRLLQHNNYQFVHRLDQLVAHMKWADQQGNGLVKRQERCVSLALYEEVRAKMTVITPATLDKVLAASVTKDPTVTATCALPESQFNAPPMKNRWTEKELKTAFGKITSDNYERYLAQKAKWSKACEDAASKGEAACKGVAPKGAVNECAWQGKSVMRLRFNPSCFLLIQPDFNPELEYN